MATRNAGRWNTEYRQWTSSRLLERSATKTLLTRDKIDSIPKQTE